MTLILHRLRASTRPGAIQSGERGYAPATVALRLTTIKAFLTYCSSEDITLVALAQSARTLRGPAIAKKPIEYLNEDETRAVLAAFRRCDGEVA